MKSRPAISVIIPVYNVEKYLSGCLDSLLAQSFGDYEAICVNDGSTDQSLYILNEYANKDKRIKIISQQINCGQSIARNKALDAVTGEQVFFLDSDDYIHSQALEYLYRCMIENNVSIVNARFEGTRKTYKPFSNKKKYEKFNFKVYSNPLRDYFKNYKNKIPGIVCNKLYKAFLFENLRFPPSMIYEDEIFTAEVMRRVDRLVDIDFTVYYYYEGREKATTRRTFDELTLHSHMTNIRYFCREFNYDKELSRLIKRTKVAGLLFGSCTRGLPYLNKQSPDRCRYMKGLLKIETQKLIEEDLISYEDFRIMDRYKLYKILNTY